MFRYLKANMLLSRLFMTAETLSLYIWHLTCYQDDVRMTMTKFGLFSSKLQGCGCVAIEMMSPLHDTHTTLPWL